MRRYETIAILDPDLSEDVRKGVLDRAKEIIVQQKGVLITEEAWGTKKLAYEIKKKPRGFYVRFDYCGMGSLVSELERFFRIDDRLMKYLTVQLDAQADVEKIQTEAASAAQTANASDQPVVSDEKGADTPNTEETEQSDDETQEAAKE